MSEKLITDLKNLPFKSHTVSIVVGYFDLLHAGHVSFLEECKKKADSPLFVVLYSDRVCGLKNTGRPIVSECDRSKLLAGLTCVDYVYIHDSEPGESYKVLYNSVKPKKAFFSVGEKDAPSKKREIEMINEDFDDVNLVFIPRQRYDISTTYYVNKIQDTKKSTFDLPNYLKIPSDIKSSLEELSLKSNAGFKTAAMLINNETCEVLSEGYNFHAIIEGTAKHRLKDSTEYKQQKPRPMHAEHKAVLDYIRAGNSNFIGCTLHSLHLPCAGCAQVIVELGIKNVVYYGDFYNNLGKLILQENDVKLTNLSNTT